jgi:hypothetical protein
LRALPLWLMAEPSAALRVILKIRQVEAPQGGGRNGRRQR